MSQAKFACTSTSAAWLAQSAVAVLYFLFGNFIHSHFTSNGIVSILWPGSGLALAVLLIGGRGYLIGLLAGSLLFNWYANSSPWAIIGITLANMLEAWFAYSLVMREPGMVRLATLRDYLHLIGLGGALAGLVGSALGVMSLLLAGYIAPAELPANFLHWWMGDTLGVVLLTPFLLVWLMNDFSRSNVRLLVRGAGLFLLTFVAGQIIFLDWFREYLTDTPKGYWMFLFIAWSAMRLGRRGTMLMVLMVAVQALVGAYREIGFFRHDIALAQLGNYWAYMLILSVIGMALATYVNDIRYALSSLKLKDSALDAAANAIAITDRKGRIEWANRAFSQLSGYALEEVVGHRHKELVKSGRQDALFYQGLWQTVLSGKVWRGELVNRRKDGILYDEEMTITPLTDPHGEIAHFVCVKQDITERKIAEQKIRNLAFFDPLTSLPNRRLLMDRLIKAQANSARSGRFGALMFIDLDNFKNLNDTLGHDVGDLLLQQVAQRLTDCVREGDTVARLGGDEFLVMLENLDTLEVHAAGQTEAIGGKILAALNLPYQLNTHLYLNSPSIGIILFRDEHKRIDDLMKQVDIAMYQAKNSGRNALRFFDPGMQEAIAARAEMESEMRHALGSQEFQLYYQIQVDAKQRAIGAECLLRWVHPTRGMVSPTQFIPLAEDTGLIQPIGLWVLETACQQLAQWQAELVARNLILSVNVSASQFRQRDFAAQVRGVVRRSGIDPAKLKLELTESMLLKDIESIISTMTELKRLGVQFSLDDFGTGYSSLQYLKRLPLDQLKIDQSFVRDIATDSNDKAIVETIIAMAHSMNLDVIAEGVETEAQQRWLLDQGCYHQQGYLFGRPVPISQFETELLFHGMSN
ncbi:MAG: EAL domain-containing protein [Gallionella sp.]|nr:EAL domain-containing protein [Gallionella sp.]